MELPRSSPVGSGPCSTVYDPQHSHVGIWAMSMDFKSRLMFLTDPSSGWAGPAEGSLATAGNRSDEKGMPQSKML